MTKNAQAGLAAAVAIAAAGALMLTLLGGDPDAPPIDDAPLGSSGATASPSAAGPGGQVGRPHLQPGGGDTSTTGPGPRPTAGPRPVRDPNQPYHPDHFGHTTQPGRGGPVAVVFVCTDGQGAPLPGVRIEAKRRSGMPLPPVVSDGRGQAKIGGLPTGEQLSGIARHPRTQAVSFGPVTVAAGKQIPLRLTAAAAMGRLMGNLKDDAGNPITADAELVLGAGEGKEGAAVLDATALNLRPDGSFTADLAVGTYAVSARGKGLTESDKSYVTIEANRTAGPVTLTLTRQASISGQVDLPTDLQGVAELKLDLVLEVTGGTDRNPYTKTDRRPLELDGANRFTLQGCDAGRYRVRLEVPQAGGNRVGPWVRFQVVAGKPITGIRLNLADVMVSVAGTVSDQDGRAVEGASVTVAGKQVTTDREGHYTLRGLSMGSLGIKASKQGYAHDYRQVNYEGSQLTVDLIVRALGGITGRVTASQTQLAGLAVMAISKNDDGYMTYSAKADAQGTYRFDSLPPGTYYLKAGPGTRDPYKLDGAPTVKVEAGRTVEAPEISLP